MTVASLQVQEQKPASWNALGVQRTLVDDFNHYLFEWPWKNLLIFIGSTYLGFIIVFGVALQLLVGCFHRAALLSHACQCHCGPCAERRSRCGHCAAWRHSCRHAPVGDILLVQLHQPCDCRRVSV